MTYDMPGNMTSLFDFLNYTHQQTVTVNGNPVLFPVLVAVLFVVIFMSFKARNNDAITSMFAGFLISTFFAFMLNLMGFASAQVLTWCIFGVIATGGLMIFRGRSNV